MTLLYAMLSAAAAAAQVEPTSPDEPEAPPNEAPLADFGFECVQLECRLTDWSSDSDGEVVAWSWELDETGRATDRNVAHTFSSGGLWPVTLTVEDDDGATDTVTRDVHVSAAVLTHPAPAIRLMISAEDHEGLHHPTLTWSGAASDRVTLWRDGGLVRSTANDGEEVDPLDAAGAGTYAYRVCEPAGACSPVVTVSY